MSIIRHIRAYFPEYLLIAFLVGTAYAGHVVRKHETIERAKQ